MASMDHSFSEAVMRYAKCTSLLKICKVWHYSTVTPKADLSSKRTSLSVTVRGRGIRLNLFNSAPQKKHSDGLL